MKGGGLTWAGWLMVGAGAMLVYAGMTGQSVVSELAAVLNGQSPKMAASDHGGSSGGSWGSSAPAPADPPAPPDPQAAAKADAAGRAIPWPVV